MTLEEAMTREANGVVRKPGFDITGEFRVARTAYGGEVYWHAFERYAEAALAVSPCSAVRLQINGETFGGLLGPHFDASVPAIILNWRQFS